MRLSSKARTLLSYAYNSRKPITTFDEIVENELIQSRLMKYEKRPLMVITHDGLAYCRKRGEGRGDN